MDELDLVPDSDPRWKDPEWQRRVVRVRRPIEFVSNVNEVRLECGHEPLLLGDKVPAVGDLQFCPDCFDEAARRSEHLPHPGGGLPGV